MCAVIGALGAGSETFVRAGLKTLSYRGHDSHGLANLWYTGKWDVERGLGPYLGRHCLGLGELTIGHARWATTGEVSIKNAHPIWGGKEEALVVHNGTLTNHLTLKEELDFLPFATDTDTEVIAHLLAIEARLTESPLECLKKVVGQLKGQYAFLALVRRYPGHLLMACDGAPLVTDNNGHVCSCPSALVGYGRHFARFPDKTVACWGPNGLEHEGRLNWQVLDVAGDDDGGMYEEILAQPAVIKEEVLWPPHAKKGVVLFGCGSSYHAALLGELYLQRLLGVHAVAEHSVELLNKPITAGLDALYVALSQSGETRDTIKAMEAIKGGRGSMWALTSSSSSTVSSLAEETVLLKSGLEKAVAATKSFAAQLSALLGWCGLCFSLQPEMEKIYLNPRLEEIALELDDHVLFLGRDYLWPIAMEAALKVKEVAYIHAEAVHAAEVKHGPLALVDETTRCIFFVGPNEADATFSNISQVRARKGRVIVFADEGQLKRVPDVHEVFPVPSVRDVASPFLFALIGQLLAYYSARANGHDVDRPRSIAKAVTVE